MSLSAQVQLLQELTTFFQINARCDCTTQERAAENPDSPKSLKIGHLRNSMAFTQKLALVLLLRTRISQSPLNTLAASTLKQFPEATMSSAEVHSTTDEKNDGIPADLLELTQAIEQLPVEHRVRLLPALRRVTESSVRRRRILTLVQEALGQLRLDMKYLVFDLEATRRERDEFLQKLNDLGAND